jgi:hypothetical protein
MLTVSRAMPVAAAGAVFGLLLYWLYVYLRTKW